jgi:hypothetical protein
MSFDPIYCWHCPGALLKVLLWLAISIVALSTGLRLANRRGALRILSASLLTLATLVYWFGTLFIIKFGIVWNSGWNRGFDARAWHRSRPGDLTLLVVWFGLSVLVARASRSRRKPVPLDRQQAS